MFTKRRKTGKSVDPFVPGEVADLPAVARLGKRPGLFEGARPDKVQLSFVEGSIRLLGSVLANASPNRYVYAVGGNTEAARRASEGERLVRGGRWKDWSPAFMAGTQQDLSARLEEGVILTEIEGGTASSCPEKTSLGPTVIRTLARPNLAALSGAATDADGNAVLRHRPHGVFAVTWR